ncbi:MAG: RHS repeat-associated core domain-containing protein [Rhizobiaceae bacterium]|nr:RHS repeat-associated core domain-containing protein [Rhizobiaceae bacterium]
MFYDGMYVYVKDLPIENYGYPIEKYRQTSVGRICRIISPHDGTSSNGITIETGELLVDDAVLTPSGVSHISFYVSPEDVSPARVTEEILILYSVDLWQLLKPFGDKQDTETFKRLVDTFGLVADYFHLASFWAVPATTLCLGLTGQLASASVNSTAAGAYVYDYLSRLVERTANAVTLHRIHDLDGNVIAEYDDTGALLTEYIWIDGRPIATIADAGTTPTLYYVLTDHLERSIMMVDEFRDPVWQASYLPFGEVRTLTGSASLDYRFPGQCFQLETGLHDSWHRHFDPSIARYLQPDPSVCLTDHQDMRTSQTRHS